MSTLDKIQELLKKRNKKQKDLTDYLGITKNAFTDWKSGRINSYMKYLPQIAEFLNCSVDYLLGRTDEPAPQKTQPVVIMAKGGDGQDVIEVSEEQYQKIKKILELMDEQNL